VTARSSQAGITFIGWLLLLVPVAIVAYAGLRLVPPVLNHYKVVSILEQLGKRYAADDQVDAAVLRDDLDKRLEVEAIEFPAMQDFSFGREDGVWVGAVRYDDQVPLFFNLHLVVRFDTAVRFK
jgi:hypothetical protein